MTDGRSPAGVVFDCDGTLADTEPISDRAWADVLSVRGYVPEASDRLAVTGQTFATTFSYFADRVALGDMDSFRVEVRTRFRARLDVELAFFEDAVGTLRALAADRIPVAVASSSPREHVVLLLERAGIDDLVAAVVGADDVDRHKPDPEPYRVAARRLGIDPEDCTAVEDTRVGIASARAAGMFTVAVLRGHVPRADLGDAHRIVDQLTVADVVPPAHVGARGGTLAPE
ncbi:MAG: HAD family phosphatase [Nitriliruptoraceae bacterium]